MKKTASIFILVSFVLAIAGWFYVQTPFVPTKPPISVFYACNDNKTIQAVFHEGVTRPATKPGEPPVPTGRADVVLSDGRKMVLPQTISADGVRYANADESFVFWSKGDGALVLENNKEKSYIGCVLVKPDNDKLQKLPNIYQNGADGISIRYPDEYEVNTSHTYEAFGSGKGIRGVKFIVPESWVSGTNLGQDTYISIESIPRQLSCSADLFLPEVANVRKKDEGGIEYSFASTSGAAAGNRYEEYVYALPGTNPCVAVRYFIHYGVYENYPSGTVRPFNQRALLDTFDAIRKTLVVSQ